MKTTGLYIFLGILLFFVFLFSLRAVITIAYSDEVALTVRVLFIKIKILPKIVPASNTGIILHDFPRT